MTHVRSTITDRVVTAISGNGVDVEKSRIYPTSDDNLPCYLVYVSDEVTDWSQSIGSAFRSMTLSISVILEGGSDNIEDQLSNHCEYIENKLNPQGSIDGTLWSRVTGTDLDLVDTGQLKMGIATLTVDVSYVTVTASAGTGT